MRIPIKITALCFFICISSTLLTAQGQTDETTDIAILGTFHFGPTSDLASIRFDDIESDKRQAEILEVVEMLAKYQPDKILLEYPYTRRERLQEIYESYLNGEYELKINERDLIGFRLAKQLGHDSVYAIDHQLDLPFDSIVQYCQSSGRMDEFNAFVKRIQDYTAEETVMLSQMTLPQFLAQMNDEKFDRMSNDLYLSATANFGEVGNEAGIEAAATWYKRNMYMLKNIDRVTKPGDRALLIVGQAHRAVLRDFIEDRLDMTFVEVSGLLQN